MNAPLAVSPTNDYPGLHLSVALVRGAQAAGIGQLKALIITPIETGQGDITVGTEIRPVTSEDDVRTATGRSLGYFGYRALLLNDPQAEVDIMAVASSAGSTATATLTFGGTPTVDMLWELDISGHVVELEWRVGDSDDAAAADAVLRINAIGDKIFAVASAVDEVTTLTARSAGPAGNDVKVSFKRISGTGGTLTLNNPTLTGGTTEVDMTTPLANAQVDEYDFILICASNTDAQAASSNNTTRLATHIGALIGGPEAKLQQGIYGSTGTRDQAKVNTAAMNNTNLEHVCFANSRDLPCEVAGAELGDRMRRRRLESNANRIRQPLKGLRGAADKKGNQPTELQFMDSANNGVTLVGYDASLNPIVLRPITTYHKDGSGNRDRRCFDVNEVDAIYDYCKDLRSGLPQEFMTPDGQVKVMRDRVEGDEPLPDNTVEERDIRAFITGRTRAFWIPKGVIHGPKFNEADASGKLIVEVNDTDETQVDIFIPAKAVKILAKLGLFVAKEN